MPNFKSIAENLSVKEDGFGLNFLFDKRTEPSMIFDQLKQSFQCLSEIDSMLLSNIDNQLEVEYSLEAIEFGSVKTWLAHLIREIPDEAIKEFEWKKLVGHFLLKAKYKILRYLENNPNIDSQHQLEELVWIIESEKSQIFGRSGRIIGSVSVFVLLNTIEPFINFASKLKDDQKLEFISFEGRIRLDNRLHLNKAKVLYGIGEIAKQQETLEILKIKKIDLLNHEPNWVFKLGNKTISAKIADLKWLDEYHLRHYSIFPEDSLKVRLRVFYTENAQGITKVSYEIIEVIDIIYPKDDIQNTLFGE